MAKVGTKRVHSSNNKKKVTVRRDDTQLVDDYVDGEEDNCRDSNNNSKPYAKLTGVHKGVANIELYENSFFCGRGGGDKPVNYSFSTILNDNTLYKYISKLQFSLIRDPGNNCTTLFDHSRNGTLVNNDLVGKNKSKVLSNGDLISIGLPRLIVFVYEENDEFDFPEQLTKKYHITNHSLGRGGYGKVLLGYKKTDKSVVALKLLNTKFSTRCSRAVANWRDVKNEVDVMTRLCHPNIVRIYDWLNIDKCSYMVLEYVAGGDFFTRVVNPKYQHIGMGESLGRYYSYQLLTAIAYLHSIGITHRDIKPENILCSSKIDRCVLKLTDFGMAKNKAIMKSKCGTPSYNAPEIVTNEGIEYTPKIDIWSLGCVLFIVFGGYPPFSEEYDDMSMEQQVLKGRLIFHSQWKRITRETQISIQRMLTVNPTKRPTAEDLINSKWMNCMDSRRARQDVLRFSKMYDYPPEKKRRIV